MHCTLVTTKMKRQEIYYKNELNLDSYFHIEVNENAPNIDYYILDKFVAGQRIHRSKGNTSDYEWLVNELRLKGYTKSLPEGVKYVKEFGIVKEMYGNWYIQKYLNSFNQAVTIGIPHGSKSEHIMKWYTTLEEKENCIQSILIKKIEHDYKDCYNGVKDLWNKEEIKDSFPILNNDNDTLNVLSDVSLDIHNEEAFTKHMINHIYSIRAKCPWDIEHGIEIEIKLEDMNSCD